MQNFIQSGKLLTIAAPADVVSGQMVQVGLIFGVATNTVASGLPLVVDTEGVYDLPKTSAEAYTVGEPIYFDADTKLLTSSSGSATNDLVAVAVATAANPSSIARVKLLPVLSHTVVVAETPA
jgi:predicted RecA/RadA family phage recombinase